MAKSMVKKYETYWNVQKINKLLYVVVVFDPRRKLEYVYFCFNDLYGETKALELKKMVKDAFVEIFEWYADNFQSYFVSQDPNDCEPWQMDIDNEDNDDVDIFSRFQKHLVEKDNLDNKFELDKYLEEKCEAGGVNFDILAWWKNDSIKYHTLSLVARDVLAMPVYSVASESAFSTGSRVLYTFRSSLAPKTVEALICAQHWLRSPSAPINLQAALDDIEKFEKLDEEIFGSNSTEDATA